MGRTDRPVVEEVALRVPLWEPGGLGRMRAWLRGIFVGYVATMEDLKAAHCSFRWGLRVYSESRSKTSKDLRR
jgi:hypothetical protein